MDKNLIDEIKVRLETNRYELRKLEEFYLKAFAPKGYKGATSYNDYDTIPSGNKEYRIEEFERERNRIMTSIKYDEEILFKLINEIDIDKYLSLLNNNKKRINYLKRVQGYTIKEIENKLGLSRRHIQRILKNNQEKSLF